MFDFRRGVSNFNVREGMCAATLADQHRVTLRIIARVLSFLRNPHQAAVGILPMTSRYALGDYLAARVPPDVDHLGAGIGLLVIIRQCNGVELTHRALTTQDAGRIFPGNGGPGFNLRPGNLGSVAATVTALGDEVIDTANAVFVPRIPILDRRVLDFGVFQADQLNHGRVQLVLVPHRRRAAFQVADMAVVFGNDQRALELAGFGGIDTEIGAQFHWTTNTAGYEHETAVREHCRIQRRKKIVTRRHHRAKVFPHQVGVILHGFGK